MSHGLAFWSKPSDRAGIAPQPERAKQARRPDSRFTAIARLRPDELEQFTGEQRRQYEVAYADYDAALAEHRKALALYRQALQSGNRFKFWYEFDVEAAYEALYYAMYPPAYNGIDGVVPAQLVWQRRALWLSLGVVLVVLVMVLTLPA